MNKDITDKIELMNGLYREASKLKDSTRKSPTLNDANVEASQKYNQAAEVACELLRLPDLPSDVRDQLEVFAPYYFYESREAQRAWHYERHETEEAEACLDRAVELLDEHIRQIELKLETARGNSKEKLDGTLITARFFRNKDELVYASIRARAAWDGGDFISAIDEYRTVIPKYAELVEKSRSLKEPVYYRIILGNYVGMVANSSGAVAKHIAETHGVPGVFPYDIACDLMRHTLEAYRAGKAACEANPEWTQFRELAQLCRSNVERFLKDNKDGWAEIYADLHDDPDLIKIMGRIDLNTLKAIERGDMPDNNELRILFLAANPLDTEPLRLDAELRSIREKLDLSNAGKKVELCQEWAVRVTDLQRAFLKHNPCIVHFTGHGSEDGEIIVEDANGDSHPIPSDALADLFKSIKGTIRCVILSSCDSGTQADGIAKHVDAVITMSDEVGELSAIAFASGFYQALAWGRSVQQAFDLGRNQIALDGFEDADVPVLKTRDGVDAAALFLVGGEANGGSDNAHSEAQHLCFALCNRWSRFDHVAFRVEEAKTVMVKASESLFELSESKTTLPSSIAKMLREVAAEMKALSEKSVKRASIYNMTTGATDDQEEKQFRAAGDAVFQRLSEFAQSLA